MKKFVRLLITHLRVITRNRSALFFTLIFPLIFIGVFGIAFQQGDPANTTIPIAIINNDAGIPQDARVIDTNNIQLSSVDLSSKFLDILSSITFEDNETNIFKLELFDDFEEAESQVERRSQKGMLIIPEDFSLAYMSAIRETENNEAIPWSGYPEVGYSTEIEVMGDTSLIQYNILVSVVKDVIDQYFSLGESSSNGILRQGSSIDSEGFTTFDYVVPGLVIFAIISNANTVAVVALNDVESKMLDRLRLTRIRKWQYPTSLVISQIVVSFVQIPILFGTALLFGFPLVPQLGLAFIFAMFVSIAMSGIGMLLAGLAANSESGGGMATIVTTPLAFLAGAFFPMPNPQILPAGILGVLPFGLFDLLPPTRAITSLRLVVFYNYGLVDVLPDLLIAAGLAVIYLFIGITVYSRRHMRAH